MWGATGYPETERQVASLRARWERERELRGPAEAYKEADGDRDPERGGRRGPRSPSFSELRGLPAPTGPQMLQSSTPQAHVARVSPRRGTWLRSS